MFAFGSTCLCPRCGCLPLGPSMWWWEKSPFPPPSKNGTRPRWHQWTRCVWLRLYDRGKHLYFAIERNWHKLWSTHILARAPHLLPLQLPVSFLPCFSPIADPTHLQFSFKLCLLPNNEIIKYQGPLKFHVNGGVRKTDNDVLVQMFFPFLLSLETWRNKNNLTLKQAKREIKILNSL